MKLELKAPKKLCPPAMGILGGEFSLPLHHKKHSLRHPLGIYSVSISQVRVRIEQVLEALEAVPTGEALNGAKKTDWIGHLLTAQKELLYAMYEHIIDDCSSVLMCLFPTKNERKRNSDVKAFNKKSKEYRRFLRVAVNHLKHNHGRLRGQIFSNANFIAPGYFVEAVLSDGALGPYPEVHGTDDIAFSFARDLRLHFIHLMFISRDLANIIKAINPPKASSDLKDDCSWVVDIGQRIEALPNLYFPNEGVLPNPWVKVSGDPEKSAKVLFSYGNSPKPNVINSAALGEMTIETTYSGDGTTRSFRIPYKNWKG